MVYASTYGRCKAAIAVEVKADSGGICYTCGHYADALLYASRVSAGVLEEQCSVTYSHEATTVSCSCVVVVGSAVGEQWFSGAAAKAVTRTVCRATVV